MTMRPDGDAAAHVGDDEVEVFVAHSLNLGMAAGCGALIEGMPHTGTPHFRTTAEVRLGQHLVDDLGIGHQSQASRQLPGEGRGDVATDVAHVLALPVARVAQHGVVHRIDSGGNGVGETAAGNDGIEIEGNAFGGQRFQQALTARGQLRETVGELRELVGRVVNGFDEHRALIVVDGHFRAGGTGIDDQNFAKRGGHSGEWR